MPRVTVFWKPSGDPMASTSSPTRTSPSEPSARTAWPGRASATMSSARSCPWARVATLAFMRAPAAVTTVT